MSKFNLTIKNWWHGLAKREQQAIALAGALLVLFVFYQAIWSPYLTSIANLRKNIKANQKTLLWMQAADKKIQSAHGENKNIPTVSSLNLLSEIKKQISQAGLERFMTQLKQAGNETLEIHFQKIEFNALINLIATMIKTQNVSILKISILAIDKPGYVNADVNLK